MSDTAAGNGRLRRRGADPSSPFYREGGRHRFTARRAHVVEITPVAPVMTRVRVTGADFGDFVSTGPGDHTRIYFPDPTTGDLVAPTATGPGEDGIVRPETPGHARDFTPLPVTDYPDSVAVDLDFFLHVSPGPASTWAQNARIGDEIVVVGPRGSRNAPQGASRVLLVCDETAMPAAGRWAAEVSASTRVQLLAITGDDGSWIGEYIAGVSGRTDVEVTHLAAGDGDGLISEIDAAAIDDTTFVFAAGEANGLIPVRRHLRRTIELPAEQVALSGYWRQGTAAFDHHAPVDPSDPDD